MFDFWPVYSGERFRASWPSCLLIYVFFSDVVMASHGGDETISYMSKFLKYAPERAGGGGRKEN